MSHLNAERALVCTTILSPLLDLYCRVLRSRITDVEVERKDVTTTMMTAGHLPTCNGCTTKIYADDSSTPMSDLGLVRSAPTIADRLNSSVMGEAVISDAVFKALIKLAFSRVEKSPLSKTMTMLLGLSTDDEVIFTKQIGVSAGEDLHGLIVSIKSNTDDIILVNRTGTMMDIYLTDSCKQLRAAATLQRDSDRPSLVSNDHAAAGFVRELNIWAMLAEIARP